MKKTLLSAALAVVLAAIPASARAAGGGTKAAIESLNQEFVTAWNAHDTKKMAAVWAEDVDLIDPFGQKAIGRAAVEKLFQAVHSGEMKASTYKIESASIRELNPSTAVGDWEIVITGMMDPDGKPLPAVRHHAVAVYVKVAGHWWIGAGRPYVFSVPPGPPTK